MAQKVPGYNSHKMKPVAKRPLEGKTFYLDLKMYPGEATLTKSLKFLGAKVEPVFSRSVSCVVTNRESARNARNVGPFKVPANPQNWSPLTPITNTACHSPLFLNESSVDYMDSPPYTNSPATDQNVVPLCRGMAMVKKAISKKQGQGTTDLIENCRLWNVKVMHVKDVFARVEKMKSHFGAHFAAEKKRTQNGERKLNPPFLKVEEKNKCRTWYREFPSSTFDNKLADKVKELYNHFKKSGNIQVAIKPAQGEFSKNKCNTRSPMAQSPAPTQSVSKSFSKFSETPKESTAFSFCKVKRKLSEHAAVASKKQKTSYGRKKKSYCEICKASYVHLDKHLASENHRIFMSNPINYLEIQNIILSLPPKEDFLLSRLPLSSDIGYISNEVPIFTSQVLNSTNTLQDPPNTCGLLDNNFTTEQFNLQGIVPAEIDDLDTETYFGFDEHYVAPSCTSPDSLYLPYLEDSIDKTMSDSSEDADINNTPLNLSSNRRRRVVSKSIPFKGPLNLTMGGFGIVDTVRKDYLSVENVMPLSNKRKLEDNNYNYIPPTKVPNSLHEVENQIPAEDKTSQQVFATQMNCIECIQAMNCTECKQASSFHGSQLGVENQTVLEDNSYQDPSVQEKNKHVSFDSGISIQASPTLTVHDSPEEDNTEAALLEVGECSVLDLSITTGSNIEVQEPTCNYCDETNVAVNVISGKSEDIEKINVASEMECDASSQDTISPTLRICESDKSTCSYTESTVANNIGNVEHLEPFKNKHVVLPTDIACDPILNDVVNIPDSNKNKSETNVTENVTYENSEDIEMPNIVSEIECDATSQDTSSPALITCQSDTCDSQSKLNKSTCPNTESTVANDNRNSEHPETLKKSKHVLPTDIACDRILNDDVGANMPPLCPDSYENKSETNVAVNVTSGKSEDFEMPNIVYEMECDASFEDNSTSIICESVPCDYPSKPDTSTCSNIESTVAHDNKSKTVDATYGKSENIEMSNVVSEMECDVSSHDSSHTIICESVHCDYQSGLNKSACSNTESTVGNAEDLETLKKSKQVVSPTDIACGLLLNDDVSLPHLSTDFHENKYDTNVAVNVASGKSEDVDTPNVVSVMECVSSSQDTSSPTIICESVPSDSRSKPNEFSCSNAEFIISNEIGNAEHLETPSDIACDTIHNDDNSNQALDSSLGFEAITVDIGTIDDSKAPHILHGSDSGISLQNGSDVTCQPASYGNQNVFSQSNNNKNTSEKNAVVIAKESECSEDSNILHNDEHKTDTQNTDHLIISSEHINIQQEAIGSKSECGNNTVDIGTFENSSCLDTSNILHGCKNDNIENTSSPKNFTNQPPQIECKNSQDKVVSSSDVKDSNFVHLCEEATKSFNSIDSDLSSSSSGGSYEYVIVNDLIDSDPDCDWANSKENLKKMFKSVCNN